VPNPYEGERIAVPPGTPLAPYGGVGVAGRFLATGTRPPQIMFTGWLVADDWTGEPPYGTYVLALHPPVPADAPPPPDDDSVWTEIVVMPWYGWLTDVMRGYP